MWVKPDVSPPVLFPCLSSLTVDVDGAGEFNVKMALFQDQSYTNPYEGAEVLLPVESILYVGVLLNRGDTSRFKLLLTNCYATPSEDRHDPVKYFIIKNRYQETLACVRLFLS